MTPRLPLLGVLLAGLCCGAAARADDTSTLLQQAIASDGRAPAHKARDVYRHPLETLTFFGLRPDMTVVELEPGGGWYTEILAPFLHDHGHLVEAAPPPDATSAFMRKMGAAYAAKLKAEPARYGRITLVPFAPPAQVALGPAGSADMVLTFRNTHDWLNDSPATLDAVLKAASDVLKPGGVLGVTEHRAKPFADAMASAKALHRIPEDYLIERGLAAGFRLAGVSQVNANPNDPEDLNVHRLPPDLAGPADEHARMQAIGESDRMTLRFVKP